MEFEESGEPTLGCGGGVELVVLEAGGTADGDEFGDGDVVAIYLEPNPEITKTSKLILYYNLHQIIIKFSIFHTKSTVPIQKPKF